MLIREALPGEVPEIPGYERAGIFLIEDGETRGRLHLSMALGQCFAHEWECRCTSPGGALLMLRAAKRLAARLGYGKVAIHLFDAQDTGEFWRKHSRKVCELREIEF